MSWGEKNITSMSLCIQFTSKLPEANTFVRGAGGLSLTSVSSQTWLTFWETILVYNQTWFMFLDIFQNKSHYGYINISLALVQSAWIWALRITVCQCHSHELFLLLSSIKCICQVAYPSPSQERSHMTCACYTGLISIDHLDRKRRWINFILYNLLYIYILK